jgi:hypothetical protein
MPTPSRRRPEGNRVHHLPSAKEQKFLLLPSAEGSQIKRLFCWLSQKHFSSFLCSWSSCWLFCLEPLFGCLCEARSPLLFKIQLGDFPFFLDFRHHINGGDAKHFSWEDSVLFDNKTKSQHRHWQLNNITVGDLFTCLRGIHLYLVD